MGVREFHVAAGAVEAVLLPDLGARLHRLRVDGHDLLRAPDDPAVHALDPFAWGGYVMAPWCNRIDPAPVEVGGRRVALDSNYDDGTAIHGQVSASPWQVLDDGGLRVQGGGNGWPWRYEVDLDIAVSGDVLRLDLALANRSEDPMPAGLGLHPWFLRPLLVAIRATAVYDSNTASRPQPDLVHGPFDLRRPGAIPANLDATWTDLADPPVVLAWPAVGVEATLRVRAATPHVVAASPEGRDAIAIEPQTHAPHGLRRLLNHEPGGLTWLDPGDSLDLGIDLTFAMLAG